MRVVVFYHRGIGEAAVRSAIFPLVDDGLIGGRRWSEVQQATRNIVQPLWRAAQVGRGR
jgi:hypothetical protein